MRLVSLALLAFCLSIYAAPQRPELDISVSYAHESYAPGDTVTLALHVRVPKGFHLYSNPLGPGIGLPTVLTVSPTPSLRWLAARKSPPRKYQPPAGEWVWAHESDVYFFLSAVLDSAPLTPPEGAVTVAGLICKESCVRVNRETAFTINTGSRAAGAAFTADSRTRARYESSLPMPLGADDPAPDENEVPAALDQDIPQWEFTASAERRSLGLWTALALAFLAGIILNVMPCVLPVLGIKVLSLAQGHQSRKQALISSLAFAAGMLTIFMVLATLAAFAGLSWGQQFQKPAFLAAIITVIFFFALGMFDLYVLILPASSGPAAPGRHSLRADFYRGLFATILATPCSGPFLGATLAWTLTRPPMVIYAVFLSLGAGMAAPYVVLALSERLTRMIPKPGRWMDDFKHAMGFFLIGFALYLMIGLPRDMVLSTVASCLFIALATALYGRFAPFGSGVARKLTTLATAAAVLSAGLYLSYGVLQRLTSERAQSTTAGAEHAWQPFSAEALFDGIDGGRNVVVDFTANWCMNCQYNMVAVLESKAVREKLAQKNTVTLVADLTAPNPVAQSLLEHLGSRSVPFLAIFPAGDANRPRIMRDVLSKKALLNALERLPD